MAATSASAAPATSAAAVDDAATAMEDAVNAITPTLKRVKFDVDAAERLVQNHDYKGLGEYVLEFQTKVQGNSFHHHPGILCSIYQAEIAHLIKVERFVEAEKVFNDKVKPLLNHNADDAMFRLGDLEYRVKMLQDCVTNRKPPAADDDENIFCVLCDYLLLYFPSCMPGDRERRGSVFDFVVAFHDEERGRQLRCLACQWVIPASTTAEEIITKHFMSSDRHVECCFRVTKWMIQYLDSLKRRQPSTEIQQGDVVVKPQPKKRKASGSLSRRDLDGKPIFFIVSFDLLEKMPDIFSINLKAAMAIRKENSESSAVQVAKAKAQDILTQQFDMISELKNLFFRSALEQAPVDSSLVSMKINSLSNLSDNLFPLLGYLPSYSERLKDLCVLIIDLKKSFIIEVTGSDARVIRPTTSSTSSTGSNTPFAGTAGTDVPGPF